MGVDRLSALDCAFLDLETPRAPMVVGWTLRFAGTPPAPAALRRHLDARLDRLPRFRRRLAEVPGGLAWVDDAGFDVARHVHAVTLLAPGGPAELRDLAGALLGAPLGLDRPLWRMYLVDGLADGGFALVGQAHHALIDGVAAVQVAQLLFDDGATPGAGSRWRPDALPEPRAAARDALVSRVNAGAHAAARLREIVTRPGQTVRAVRDLAGTVGDLATPAPMTALDRSATAKRAVAFGSAPLDAVKEAGARRGATVNDVLLAASTLALGHALARRDEKPRALRALVPVSTRAEGAAGDLGNAVSFALVELPVGLTDPTAALRAIRDRTRAAKRDGAAKPLAALAQAGDLLPARGRRAVARAAARLAAYNVVVSHVPGPPFELRLMGRPLTAIHPAVPFMDGHGLSIGAFSYAGRMELGVLGDAAVLPDAVDLARDIESAFDALRLAGRPGAQSAGPTPWRERARERRARTARR